MKTLNFLTFRLCYSFYFYRVEIVTVSIPDNADDTHYDYDDKAVIYWIGGNKTTISLPAHKKGKEVFLTPMYNRLKTSYNTNRIIKIELLN